MGAVCIRCICNIQYQQLNDAMDETAKIKFLKEVASVVASCAPETTSVELSYICSQLQKKYFGKIQDFEFRKKYATNLMLEHQMQFQNWIETSSDPIVSALKFAMAGNFLDFAVVKNEDIDKDGLLSIINHPSITTIEKSNILQSFFADMSKAKHVVYITDNCGEILLDKLFIEQLLLKYSVEVTVIVRGESVLNDATIIEAQQVGMNSVANVIGNGTPYAGTVVNKLSYEAKMALFSADVIVSKGQGNFETLAGHKLNIYYMFLCKCERFTRRFNVTKNSAIFINENQIGNYL